MTFFKKFTSAIVAASLFIAISTPSFAADSALKEIFEDGFYGGLTGTLVGAALLAFTSKPGDHLDYLGVGAAIGVKKDALERASLSAPSVESPMVWSNRREPWRKLRMAR